jgi:hypothetical protein
MNDITQLLQDAAPTPSELDLDRIHREGRRRRQRPRRIAVAVVVTLGLVTAGAIAVLTRDDHAPRRVIVGPATQPQNPTTLPPTTAGPTTTAAPPTTAAPTTDGPLSTTSRLGYAGLGAIKLGMTLDEAAAAAGVTFTHADPDLCPVAYIIGNPDAARVSPEARPFSDRISIRIDHAGRIMSIETWAPELFTISGVHVSDSEASALSTYPNAEVMVLRPRSQRAVVITNPEGHVVVFYETWEAPGDRSKPEPIVSIITATSLDVAAMTPPFCGPD